jgi:hypothetical protein
MTRRAFIVTNNADYYWEVNSLNEEQLLVARKCLQNIAMIRLLEAL